MKSRMKRMSERALDLVLAGWLCVAALGHIFIKHDRLPLIASSNLGWYWGFVIVVLLMLRGLLGPWPWRPNEQNNPTLTPLGSLIILGYFVLFAGSMFVLVIIADAMGMRNKIRVTDPVLSDILKLAFSLIVGTGLVACIGYVRRHHSLGDKSPSRT